MNQTNETSVPDSQAEVKRITDTIMEGLGDCTLQDALTVICGIGGHLVASICEGRLGDAKLMAANVGLNMHKSALAKMLRDAEKRAADLAD